MVNESGLCACGCGEATRLAPINRADRSWVRGQPMKYVAGHWGGRDRDRVGPNPSGLCQCGCGGKTAIASRTWSHDGGAVAGKPLRWLPGHAARIPVGEIEPPNPGGLCQCGCGQPTSLAAVSQRATGDVAGTPQRFVYGHGRTGVGGYGTIADRLWKHVEPTGFCWQWTGPMNADGYGFVRVGGGADAGAWGERRARPAHSVAYEILIGQVPDGLVIDHLCRNHSCVNPDHLEPVTVGENFKRGKGRGGVLYQKKRRCKWGHAKPVPGKSCPECASSRQRGVWPPEVDGGQRFLVPFNPRALGEQVEIERHTRRWSRRDLARMAEVTEARMGEIERGDAPMSYAELERVAFALDTPREVLRDRAKQLV